MVDGKRGAVLPDAAVGGGQPAGQDHRGPGHHRQARRAAARLHRRTGGAVRLLHRRHDHAGAGAAGAQPHAQRRRDPRAHGHQPLPLRHAHAHPAGGASGGKGWQSAARAPAREARHERRSSPARGVLAGGGALVVASACGRQLGAPAQATRRDAGPKLPGSLQAALPGRLDPDRRRRHVTVFTGKAELGQGIKTALVQVAAEELVVDPERMTIVTADTARTPNEGYTAGSHSMQDSGTAIRNAAAQVRVILPAWPAQRLGVAPEQLQAHDGTLKAPDGRSVGYGELVAGDVLHVQAQPQSALRRPAQFTRDGRNLPRLDIPAKVTGGVAYVQDLRLPGMVHARVLRPPSPPRNCARSTRRRSRRCRRAEGGARRPLRRRDRAARMAGRHRHGARSPLPRNGTSRPRCRRRTASTSTCCPGRSRTSSSPSRATASPAARRRSAGYVRPYQLHGSIGPSCAVAQVQDGMTTVWTHSQGVFPLRKALAELLGQATTSALHPHGGLRLLRPQCRRRRRRPMPRCSHRRCPASRCACSGCARTSTCGSPTARRW